MPGPLGAGTNININNGAIIIPGFNSHSTDRPIIISIGATFSPGNGTLTLSGPLSGNGGFSTTGNGVIILTGTNTFTGDVFISSSIVRIANGQAIPNTAEVFIGGGANPPKILDLNNSSETIGSLRGGDATGGNVTLGTGTLTIGGDNSDNTYDGTISGTGGVVKIGTGTQTLTRASIYTGSFTFGGGSIRVPDVADSGIASPLGAGSILIFDSGTLILDGTANESTNRPITLNSSGGTFNVANESAGLSLLGVISGTGSLTKTGPAALSLSNMNTFTGPLVINGGTVTVNSLANSGVISAIGAGNSIVLNGGGLFYSAFGTVATDRPVTLNGGGSLGPGNGTVQFSGPITGTGELNIEGPGMLILSSTNTYSGATTVTNTTVQLANGNAIPNTSAVSLKAAAKLDLNNSNETIGSLGGGSASGGNVDLGSGTLITGGDDSSTAYDGVISGTGGLTKAGTGTMTLTRTSTFTGPLTIQRGGISTPILAAAGVNSPIGAGNLVTLGQPGNLGTLSFTSLDDGATDRSIVLNGGASGGGGFTVSNALSTLNLDGSISGTGSFVKDGPGALVISGNPTYTGSTTINAGRLTLSNGLDTPGGLINIAANGTLQTRNIVNRTITGAGTITASGSLIIGNASSASGFAFSGTLEVGSHHVVLEDADTAQLGATTRIDAGGRLNSFNGILLSSTRTVVVSAGASASISSNFTNNGSVAGPSDAGKLLTFNNKVSGIGSYTGNVQFSDGLSPGINGAASILLENFSFLQTTTLSLELGGLTAGSQHDRLVFTGTGAIDGTLNITLINGFQPALGNTFILLDGGTLTGAFDTINFPALGLGLTWNYSQGPDTAFLTVVPEPSGTVIAMIGGIAAWARRRKR